MNIHFYHCAICGKVIAVLSDTGVPTVCCGETMEELIPNTTDGVTEKHVPVIREDGSAVTVRIGSAPHPMEDSHRIPWIGLRTAGGFQFRELCAGEEPEAAFALSPGDCAETAFAFCNLHGLWSAAKEACK